MRVAVVVLACVFFTWSLADWVAETYRTLGTVAALLALAAIVIAIRIAGCFKWIR
jgi:Na+/H+ antiporter NhaD/arsenite permease-like protein